MITTAHLREQGASVGADEVRRFKNDVLTLLAHPMGSVRLLSDYMQVGDVCWSISPFATFRRTVDSSFGRGREKTSESHSRFGLERSETKPSVWGERSELAELP